MLCLQFSLFLQSVGRCRSCISIRYMRHKPWVPKFRLLRQLQPWDGPPDLSAQSSVFENETSADLRRRLKRIGAIPSILFQDRPINIGHSGQITDPYIPPEGDGRASLLSTKSTSAAVDILLNKGKSYRATLKIRSYEPSFNVKGFANEAQFIYVEAQNLLQDVPKNESRLFELVTEKALAEMTSGLKFRTLRWNFVGSIEPSRVVRVRVEELLAKGNYYGQVTVRMHTQQTIAIYDRFGRLLYGNPNVPVDVLEYVVFEKHISDEYGMWRVHAKILPKEDYSANSSGYIPTQRVLKISDVSESTVATPALMSTSRGSDT